MAVERLQPLASAQRSTFTSSGLGKRTPTIGLFPVVTGGPGLRRVIVFDIAIQMCLTQTLTQINQGTHTVLKLIATAAIATAIASPSIAADAPKWPCYIHPATGVCEPAAFLVKRFRDDSKQNQTTSHSTFTSVTRLR